MTKRPTDISASVRGRLARLARERGEDVQLLLSRYVNERLLYRLGLSPHARLFVLKGATLFSVWTGRLHRATRDVDLLGFGDASEERMRNIFSEVLSAPAEDDGVVFDVTSLEVGPIREDQAYGGIRAVLIARVATAKVRVQVDIAFGDAVHPAASTIEMPVVLAGFPPPIMRAYKRETVVAEKLEAMATLGIANSRMKDFFDVALLARTFDFEADSLVSAISATFGRRGTALASQLPLALTPGFAGDAAKNSQWFAFIKKSGTMSSDTLASTVSTIAHFLSEPYQVAAMGASWSAHWPAGGPWSVR